jgi:hypothetical protein
MTGSGAAQVVEGRVASVERVAQRILRLRRDVADQCLEHGQVTLDVVEDSIGDGRVGCGLGVEVCQD